MEANLKNLISKILAHQLEGIMLHFDLMKNYKVMGMDKMAMKHYKHMRDESECHAKTVLKVIEKYHEPVAPDSRNRVAIPAVMSEPKDMLDKFTIHTQYLEAWKHWEESTVSLYDEIIKASPDCKMWPMLKAKAEHEVHCVKRIMSDLA